MKEKAWKCFGWNRVIEYDRELFAMYRKVTRLLSSQVVFGLVILATLLSFPLSASETINTKAPTFYITDLAGEDFFASQHYGSKAKEPRVVVLSFFATWCVPCRSEIPQLEILSKEFPDIKFYLVSVKDEPSQILQWLNKLGVELPVLVDAYGRTAKKFNVITESDSGKELASLPSLFVINKAGKIVYEHTGYKPGDEINLKHALESIH